MEENVSNDHKNKQKEIEDGKGMAALAYIGVIILALVACFASSAWLFWLALIGACVLALVPYFVGDKKNKFVRYHAAQGMSLTIIAIGYLIVVVFIIGRIIAEAMIRDCVSSWSAVLSGCNYDLVRFIGFILALPAIAIGVLGIIGLINALNGKEKEVPILGKIKIIKQ